MLEMSGADSSTFGIHQLLPSLYPGDAIGNHALAVRELLRSAGINSEIVAGGVHAERQDRGALSITDLDQLRGVCIYHFSIGDELLDAAFPRCPMRKVIWYHNITPDYFFAPYNQMFYQATKKGREILTSFIPIVETSVADSSFNAHELTTAGYSDPQVLPILLDNRRLSLSPDPVTLQQLGDGKTNILFVGRLAPNKRQEDVIRVFSWYNRNINPNSRLGLIGETAVSPEYLFDLQQVAADCGVARLVEIPGRVSRPVLTAWYKSAHIFLSLSAHEGFCVPLVEAMYFGKPIIALAQGAVPETLGNAGILVKKFDAPLIAEAIQIIQQRPLLAERIVSGQNQRLTELSPEAVRGKILNWAEHVLKT